ncbi:MAG: hypothetical protein AABY53_00185 [Bdellovibrionota bacterium]
MLLLVITVGLIMGASRMFKGLNSFIDSYIGGYTICLMEYGELPTLGVEEAAQKTHLGATGCDSKFDSFTFSSGRPPTAGSGSSGGRGSGSGASGSNKNSSSSANKDSSGDGSDDKDGSGIRRGGGRASTYAKGQVNRSSDLGTADGPSSASNKKIKVIEEDGAEEKRSRRGSSSNTPTFAKSNIKYKAITGALAEEIKKRSPRIQRVPAKTVVAVASETGSQVGPFKKTFTPPEPKKVEVREEDGSAFSFGNILRWLIIGGMIIALIVFFGGQIMNYSNSKD